jgi:uncharacterized protein (TIGR04255 family)
MKIKASTRVAYKRNPLLEVLCQVRFNRLLTLERDLPVELQAKFAEAGYPKVTVDRLPSIQVAWTGSNGDAPVFQDASPSSTPSVYHFVSTDELNKISLTSDFIAFSCQKYERWGIFQPELIKIINLFTEIYGSATPVRVGLRYRDLISREDLGLAGKPWAELVTPLVGGVFHAQSYFENDGLDEASVRHQATQIGLSLDDCELLLQSALLKAENGSGLEAFLIDTDFSQESPKHDLTFSTLEDSLHALHNSAGAIFRHCIQETLHDALGPVDL